MGIRLNRDSVDSIITARRSKMMTQLELSRESRISLRTIQHLETMKRNSFSESTLIALCRTLEIDLETVLMQENKNGPTRPDPSVHQSLNQTEYPAPNKKGVLQQFSRKRFIPVVILLACLFIVGYRWVSFSGHTSAEPGNILPRDWMITATSSFNQLTPEHPRWGDYWKNSGPGTAFNRLDFPRLTFAGDTIEGMFTWSYHYPDSAQNVHINLFVEWKPEHENKLFEGELLGDSCITQEFKLVCPLHPGLYRARLFYGMTFAPITSFYGMPELKKEYSDINLKYLETKVVILPDHYRNKVNIESASYKLPSINYQ